MSAPTATYAPNATPPCPDCGGPMFDERKSKFYDPTKNRPLFKCKNKGQCDGAIWPPRQPQAAALAAPAVAPVTGSAVPRTARQPHNAGGPLPYEAESAPAPEQPDFADLVMRYEECFGVALSQAGVAQQKGLPLTGEAIAAVAATLFIERNRRGV